MIELHYIGRMGNQIFQYVFARIMAEETGLALPNSLPGFPYAGPVEGESYDEPTKKLRGHELDLQALLRYSKPRRFILTGYYQRVEYYEPYADRIRQWLRQDDEDFRRPEPGTLVAHVRGGDLYDGSVDGKIHPGYPATPYHYYARLIAARRGVKHLAIVSDKPDDPVASRLADRFGGERINQSALEDFSFLRHADDLILSMSSFAWWAAWLSSARRIDVPLIGLWHPLSARTDVNLIVPQSRYRYWDLGVDDEWTASPEQIEAVLAETGPAAPRWRPTPPVVARVRRALGRVQRRLVG